MSKIKVKIFRNENTVAFTILEQNELLRNKKPEGALSILSNKDNCYQVRSCDYPAWNVKSSTLFIRGFIEKKDTIFVHSIFNSSNEAEKAYVKLKRTFEKINKLSSYPQSVIFEEEVIG